MSKRTTLLAACIGVCGAFYLGYSLSYTHQSTMKEKAHPSSMDHDVVDSLQKEVVRLESLQNHVSALLIGHGLNKIGEENINLQDLKRRLDELANKSKQVDATASSKDGAVSMDDDTTLADKLYQEVRVLCWVMTAPKTWGDKAVAIKNTWGRRCNKLLFFSSVSNDTLPAIGLNTPESREFLTMKTNRAFRYVYKHYFNDYDWFMRTDDDGYVIMENLRHFLSSRDTNQPVYFGHHFKTIVKGGYFSGGPGIILGREALKRFGERSLDASLCAQERGADDVELGKCLYNFGVYAANTSDRLGRSRFHCFNPETHIAGGYPDWFYKYDANGAHHGISSMSEYAIGFHYVSPIKMYELHYFIYHLRPYGISFRNKDLNQPWQKGNITVGPII